MTEETAQLIVSLLESIDSKLDSIVDMASAIVDIQSSMTDVESAVGELRMDISGFEYEGKRIPGKLDQILDAVLSMQ
jgi:hypothetical protein